MPPRTPSCCRAVRHSITTPRDSIWISDSQLATAFERFCSVSRSDTRRSVSNVPGPLESRRRLGKRRIADLQSLQLHPSLPAWALPIGPDLSQWQWKPPTDALVRQQRHEEDISGFSLPRSLLPAWLLGWDAEVQHAPVEETMKETPVQVAKRGPLLEMVQNLRRHATDSASASDDSIIRQYGQVCDRFSQRIRAGSLTTEEIQVNFRKLCGLLESDALSVQLDGFYLLEAVASGIESCKLPIAKDLDREFWVYFVTRLASKMYISDLPRLFPLVVSAMPASIERLSQRQLLPILDRLFEACATASRDHDAFTSAFDDATEASRDVAECAEMLSRKPSRYKPPQRTVTKALLSHDVFRKAFQLAYNNLLQPLQHPSSREIAKALARLDVSRQSHIIMSATRSLTNKADSLPEPSQARFALLVVLSHMPEVQQRVLLNTTLRLYNNAATRQQLSDTMICELLLNRWTSRGYLLKPLQASKIFHEMIATHSGGALGALAYTIRRSTVTKGSRSEMYANLWRFVRQLHREENLMDSLGTVMGTDLDVDPELRLHCMQEIAHASDDLQIAMQIHNMSTEFAGTPSRKAPVWTPSFWVKFVGRGAMDSLDSEQLYTLLEIGRYSDYRHVEGRIAFADGRWLPVQYRLEKEISALIEKVVMRTAINPQLTQAQAIRRLQGCKNFFMAHRQPIPVAIHKAFLHVITRDLDVGEIGRTSRLRWFLDMVRGQYGEDVALECGKLLKRWREAVGGIRSQEMKPQKMF